MQLDPLIHPKLNVTHGFFTRKGGNSLGIHAGLNCGFGSGDDPEIIKQNRKRVTDFLNVTPNNLVTAHQIHSADVAIVEKSWSNFCTQKGDAMVTSQTGIALGILTADCTPVLFADTINMVIGAAHAGWRGSLAGVLEATVETMEKQGAKRKNIIAVIGPCIAQDSYEVGPEFRATFIHENSDNGSYFRPSVTENHHQFDLAGFVVHRLKNLALGQCYNLARDTYTEKEYFYSYRRSCHNRESDYGRQISAIALTTESINL